MKIKDYFNSLVSRRKSTPSSSKSTKLKSHHASIASTDCHYEICGYEVPQKLLVSDHPSRTEILLNRHAQLVNTIIDIRSQQDCQSLQRSHQEKLFHNRNYNSSTLATSNPRRECQQQTSNNNSLSKQTRQRTKIRTNPWIKSNRPSQPAYSIFNPTLSSGLIHSESFPQTISNGNIHPTNTILRQSDSGQGISLSSSRMIDSSSPDNTSSDGPIIDEKQYCSVKTNPLDYKRRRINSLQSRYQRPSNTRIITSPKKLTDHSRSSSSHLHNDQFSLLFEDIVENERFNKQRSPSHKSPFILPLDESDIQSSCPSPKLYSNITLKKTNSHTILKHIEEIENEIRLMRNLNLHSEEQILAAEQDERQSIHEQVDQWVEECLTKTKYIPTTLPHPRRDRFSNPINQHLVRTNSDKKYQTSSLPKPPKKTELMIAFYLSSIPTISSFISPPITKDFKSIYECPF